MPPLVNYAQCLKVRTLMFTGSDIDISATWHFTYTGTAPTDATCAALAAAILAGAVTNLLPLMGGDTGLSGVSVQDLTSPTSGFGESLASHTGSRAGAYLPAAACALLNQPIARRYRGGKPRTYWPFGTAGDLVNTQSWSSAAQSAFQSGIQLYLDVIVGLTSSGTTIGPFVSLSYYQGFTAVENPITGRYKNVSKPRSVAIAPDGIITFSINANVASQRRRNLHGS